MIWLQFSVVGKIGTYISNGKALGSPLYEKDTTIVFTAQDLSSPVSKAEYDMFTGRRNDESGGISSDEFMMKTSGPTNADVTEELTTALMFELKLETFKVKTFQGSKMLIEG